MGNRWPIEIITVTLLNSTVGFVLGTCTSVFLECWSISSSSFIVRFPCYAQVGRFPSIKLLQLVLSNVHSFFSPRDFKSCQTHSPHVFLLLPQSLLPLILMFLQEDVQSVLSLRSRCPNHLDQIMQIIQLLASNTHFIRSILRTCYYVEVKL